MIEFKVSFTDDEVKCLEAIIPDVQKWLQEAADGKLSQCKKKIIIEWQPKLFADGGISSLPSTEKETLDFIFANKQYTSRKDRDYDEREDRILKEKRDKEKRLKNATDKEAQRQAEIDAAVQKALAAAQ